MPLSDLTFQLDTGPVMNLDPGSGPFIDVQRIRGLDSAPFRTTERDHEGVDGSFMDAEFEKGRSIIVEGTVYATTDTIESYLDTLKETFAPSRTLKPFVWKAPGVNERVLFVKPTGIAYDWESARRIGCTDFQAQMFAEIPLIFDNNVQSPFMSLGALVTTGFGFNLGFNFGFGGVSSTVDGVTFVVEGNRPTPATFIMTGPVLNPQIISDTAGLAMAFQIELFTGDTLVVDTYYRTVKLNDVANRRNTLVSPNWFHLATGTNFIRYRAETATASTLTVQYRPAWR